MNPIDRMFAVAKAAAMFLSGLLFSISIIARATLAAQPLAVVSSALGLLSGALWFAAAMLPLHWKSLRDVDALPLLLNAVAATSTGAAAWTAWPAISLDWIWAMLRW